MAGAAAPSAEPHHPPERMARQEARPARTYSRSTHDRPTRRAGDDAHGIERHDRPTCRAGDDVHGIEPHDRPTCRAGDDAHRIKSHDQLRGLPDTHICWRWTTD